MAFDFENQVGSKVKAMSLECGHVAVEYSKSGESVSDGDMVDCATCSDVFFHEDDDAEFVKRRVVDSVVLGGRLFLPHHRDVTPSEIEHINEVCGI